MAMAKAGPAPWQRLCGDLCGDRAAGGSGPLQACADCHGEAAAAWAVSHHAAAWTEASPDTVLADFDGTEFAHDGTLTKFRIEDGRYHATVTEKDGKKTFAPCIPCGLLEAGAALQRAGQALAAVATTINRATANATMADAVDKATRKKQ